MLPIYIAFVLCFPAVDGGHHCVMRSWWQPLSAGHPTYGACMRAKPAGPVHPVRWRAGDLICSHGQLPYPSNAAAVPPDRYA